MFADPPAYAKRSVEVALEMIEQFRYDEACVFLFQLNKNHPEEWNFVKNEVLGSVGRPHFLTAATLVRCSAKDELSACETVVPGLRKYTRRSDPELLD
jgi:hypothetical protein